MKTHFVIICWFLLLGGMLWGADYLWLPVDWASYGELSNWEIKVGEGGVPATVLPGTGDRLYDFQSFKFDLGGASYEVGGWRATWDWNSWDLYLRHGRLCFTGLVETHRGIIELVEDAVLAFGPQSTFTPSTGDGAQRSVFVNDGTVFDFRGKLDLYKMWLYVRSGGLADLAYSTIGLGGSEQENIFENNGTLILTNGVTLVNGSKYNGKLRINQQAGELIIGGKVSNKEVQARLEVLLYKGLINVTDDVWFEVTEAKFADNADLEIEVVAGKVLDITPFVYGTAVSLKQSGAGGLGIGATLPANLQIEAGALVCAAADVSYDLAPVIMASDTRLVMATTGITLHSVPSGTQYTFGIDPNKVSLGVPFVSITDSALRARVKADIEAELSTDYALLELEDTLVLNSAYLFNSITTSDWHDPTGWLLGTVPPANKDIQISGAGVVARIAAEILPCKSIKLMEGATLQVATDVTLPKVTLTTATTLQVEAEAVLEIATAVVTQASQLEDLPTLLIESGAHLKVPANTRFSNLELQLFGHLETMGVGKLTLGYAKANESAYFKMTADGGKITMPASGSYDVSVLQVGCPASGGQVLIPEPIYWHQLTLPSVSWQQLHGVRFGVHNPVEYPFTVIVDDTRIKRGSYCDVNGAVTLCLTNNAILDSDENDNLVHDLRINKRGQIVVHEGALLSHLIANGGVTPMSINPDELGFESLIVHGGRLRLYDTGGNNQACLKVYGGTFELYRQNNSQANSMPFKGLHKVELAEAKTLTMLRLASHPKEAGPVILADVPLTGDGSFYVDNENVTRFDLVMVNSDNSATGTIGASSEAKLWFDHGANWQGTVVANDNVALTNCTEGLFFATNTFGGLELQGDFPLRVGAAGNDALVLGTRGFTGTGKLVIQGIDDYDYRLDNRSLLLGSVLRSAKHLPACEALSGWGLMLRADPVDQSRLNLWLVRKGLCVIVR